MEIFYFILFSFIYFLMRGFSHSWEQWARKDNIWVGLIQKNKNESELYHEYFYFIFNKSFKDEKYNEINVARWA